MKSVGRKRLFIWGAVGLVIVIALVLAMAPRPQLADFEPVVRGALQVTLDHEGKTRVRDRFVISAPVPGRVRRIELEPGDRVVADETVLATFEASDPQFLDSRSRAEARAGIKAAQSALETARAERERAQAEWEFAETELERNQRLADQGIVSQGQLDVAKVQARASHEALLAAESAARTALHRLEAANARLLEPGDGQRPGRSGRLFALRSPVSGVVLRRLRESEAVVPMGDPLIEVADLDAMEVVADFLSNDAVKMRPGMAALIDQWGGDQPIARQVRRIEPAGFMKISALGVEEQRVNVVVDFDVEREIWGALGDGYRVEVRVIVWQAEDVLKVPTSSLFRHEGDWAVFVAEGGRARLRGVEVGQRNGLEAEVLGGLDENELVIAHPSDTITDGARVAARG